MNKKKTPTLSTRSRQKKPVASRGKKIRYAVVGLGHIAQVAVLPGFKRSRSSELVALVSGDEVKLRELSRKYGISRVYTYEQYDECLKSGEIDAVYIALPNEQHAEFAIRAAQAGIHVLCEKPMAVSARDCERMIRAAKSSGVKQMIAYRLHFDPANLETIRLVQSGKIGDIRYFNSEFGYELKPGNIRLRKDESGGPLHDIGIYCINAARYLFRDEPTEVFAYGASSDAKFRGIQETVTAVMKFPRDRLASFTCSFGIAAIGNFRVMGSKGDIYLENAYEYVGEVTHKLTVKEKSRVWKSKPGDQFAAELEYFSQCVLKNREPEPSGLEGLADVRIVEALYRSLRTGRSVPLKESGRISSRLRRPSILQAIHRHPHREPKLVKVQAPSK